MIDKRIAALTVLFSRRAFGSKFIVHLIPATILAACLSPLDRFSDYVGGDVVISGQISPLPETNAVYVARTSDRERLPEPVTGADIVLYEDGNIARTYVEDSQVPGKYVLPDFAGFPGRSYHIDVVLPGGQRFASAPEQMPEAIGEDDITYSIEPMEFIDGDGTVSERFFINIFNAHRLPSSSQDVFLKWHVEEVYALSPTDFPDPFARVPPTCYVAQPVDPQRMVLFSNEGITATSITELLLVSRQIDATFKERHYFTAYQSSLAREAFEYWEKVNVVANQSGSIFDTPPARITGNITSIANPDEQVHGYFQAVNQRMDRFYLLPDDLPFRLTVHCEYRPDREFNDYPPECLDCLSVRNSSYNRPPWF